MFGILTNYLGKRRLFDKRYSFLYDAAKSEEYVSFDTETTGLSPEHDKILSIGAVKLNDNKILKSEKFEVLIKPDENVGGDSIKVHRLRNIDLEGGIRIEDGIYSFLEYIRSRPLIGYYISFDVAIINKYVKELLGIRLPNKVIDVSHMYLKYKRALMHDEEGEDRSFDRIMQELELPILEKHDALNDAIMTAMIFLKLQGKRGKLV